MPCVYATAIHCLIDVGRLQKGESVLIHSACGGKSSLPVSKDIDADAFILGVGLAAIQVCKKIVGAEVSQTSVAAARKAMN